MTVESVYVHPEVVFATVHLPDHIPVGGRSKAYVKFRASPTPSASGSIVLSVIDDPQSLIQVTPPGQIILQGTVEMEMAAPRPGQGPRPQRLADESQGTWVHVKKHSSMNCAVVWFPSSHCRDAVLMQGEAALQAEFRIPFDLKPHREKTAGGAVEVSEALFVGWKKGYGYADHISASSLQVLFDALTDPLMRSCLRSDTLADTLLHQKSMGQSWTASSGEEVLLQRLTRMARSPPVRDIMLHSPVLEACRRRVRDLNPPWGQRRMDLRARHSTI